MSGVAPPAFLRFRHIHWHHKNLKNHYQFEGQVKIQNEPETAEIDKVATCLEELRTAGIINEIRYDMDQFRVFRKVTHETMFIFWTAINPPMERLLYALSDILKPKVIFGFGIFTGNPLVWSLGPAIQGRYPSSKLSGVEFLGRDNK